MNNVSLIGIDLGKNSFHVHCQDATGRALNRKSSRVRNYSNSLQIAPQQLLLWKLAQVLTIWPGKFRSWVIHQS